ncbi:hypothetical protein L211DRAFT_503260 [Terfezia boudieri ATCC MYA-4762]|uniref:Uncharacterized protein n=1 Tax=Terfezia boudieri ATCC MYA-4762 TaxID=1051890 RepID=A0A3N4LCX3_9PEZI|nr:hypothetical protein L211DRAFT_503260 [Terfezia boudieri ATCC MYA-4762]
MSCHLRLVMHQSRFPSAVWVFLNTMDWCGRPDCIRCHWHTLLPHPHGQSPRRSKGTRCHTPELIWFVVWGVCALLLRTRTVVGKKVAGAADGPDQRASEPEPSAHTHHDLLSRPLAGLVRPRRPGPVR